MVVDDYHMRQHVSAGKVGLVKVTCLRGEIVAAVSKPLEIRWTTWNVYIVALINNYVNKCSNVVF